MVEHAEGAIPAETPISVELLRHGLATVADEMAIAHVRAAYSSVVRDMLDFSTAVCDAHGRVVAQGLSLALQLGAIPRFMRELTEVERDPQPGDVYLLNHPWQGGVHLPDFFFAMPVFAEGDDVLFAYTVIVSHMVDVGGRFPGGVSAAATSLWDEGLVIPHVPLVKAGAVNGPLVDVIAANSRDPVRVRGDIRAVLAGLETGARQLRDLVRRLGAEHVRSNMDELLARSEQATRAAIRNLPDGSGHAEDFLDDDGAGGPPVAFACAVEKMGDRLRFDFTGTAGQLPTSFNTTIADVTSVVAFVTRSALAAELDVNDGFYRCLEFVAPLGTVVNARYPAAVGSRAGSMYRLTDVAMAALGQVVPDRIPANDGGPAVLFFSGRDPSGRDWILLDYVQAGWGATACGDGVAGVSHPISNAANVPVEVIEEENPLRVLAYGLQGGTGGAGRHVGAPSVVREYEILSDGTTVNFRVERMLHAPSGSGGGDDGRRSSCAISRAGEAWTPAPGKGTVVLGAGDRVRVELASGGGFGEPEAAG